MLLFCQASDTQSDTLVLLGSSCKYSPRSEVSVPSGCFGFAVTFATISAAVASGGGERKEGTSSLSLTFPTPQTREDFCWNNCCPHLVHALRPGWAMPEGHKMVRSSPVPRNCHAHFIALTRALHASRLELQPASIPWESQGGVYLFHCLQNKKLLLF